MKRRFTAFTLALTTLPLAPAVAGPFPPAAGEPGSTAIAMDDPAIVAWATGYQDYIIGDPPPDATFQTPEKTLGPADGTSFDVVSLGDGGKITYTFDLPIANGDGYDFAVFDNSFADTWIELAWVEVSNDGDQWYRFPNISLTPEAIGSWGTIDPTDIDGFAGKYRAGYGTPFDLDDVGLSMARYVRIVDIIGDGSALDSENNPIYDPYPQFEGGVGFEVDAIGVMNVIPEPASVALLATGGLLLLRRRR